MAAWEGMGTLFALLGQGWWGRRPVRSSLSFHHYIITVIIILYIMHDSGDDTHASSSSHDTHVSSSSYDTHYA